MRCVDVTLRLLPSISSVVTGQWILVYLICVLNDFIAISLFFEKYGFCSIKTEYLVEVLQLEYLIQQQMGQRIHLDRKISLLHRSLCCVLTVKTMSLSMNSGWCIDKRIEKWHSCISWRMCVLFWQLGICMEVIWHEGWWRWNCYLSLLLSWFLYWYSSSLSFPLWEDWSLSLPSDPSNRTPNRFEWSFDTHSTSCWSGTSKELWDKNESEMWSMQ